MAQTPWEVCESTPIDAEEASHLVKRCHRDLKKHLSASSDQWSSLLTQMATFRNALALEKGCLDKISVHNHYPLKPTNTTNSKATSSSGNSANKSVGRSPFTKITVRGTAQLHPCFMGDAEQGVRAFLANFLLKYVPEFEGLWVAYHPNIEALDTVGFVNEAESMAIITFPIKLVCLVLGPRPGHLLAGVVSKVRPTNVVVLVCGIFNGCIQRRGLDYQYVFSKNQYKSKEKGVRSIKTGCLLVFFVTRFHYSRFGEVMTIEGSLGKTRGVMDPMTLELAAGSPDSGGEDDTDTTTNTELINPFLNTIVKQELLESEPAAPAPPP